MWLCLLTLPKTRQHSFTWCGILLTNIECKLFISVNLHMRNLAIHKQCGAFILTRSFTSDVTYFFTSSTWDILYPGMEGAFEVEMSCFGVTLYQYTASIIEHYFLIVILLRLQWYLFTMLFPAGTCIQQNQKLDTPPTHPQTS